MSILTPYEISGDLEPETGAFPAPFISIITPPTFAVDVTGDITIQGSFFTPTTTVTLSGAGTVNSTTFISDNEMVINYTSGSNPELIDFTVDNGQSATFSGILEVMLSTWIDLRLGANTFTHGNGAGNDIRYRAGMTMVQDADGMSFNNANPWSSWAKFEFLQWTRGELKTCEWVMTAATAAMMIGIGSTNTNETSTAQYYQQETLAYIQNSTTLWGLFGNNGTPGGGGNQNVSTTITPYVAYKVSFTLDGSNGGQFTLYGLTGTGPADWEDTSNVIADFTIGGTLNPDELDIMPVVIPRSVNPQRFIAVRVVD